MSAKDQGGPQSAAHSRRVYFVCGFVPGLILTLSAAFLSALPAFLKLAFVLGGALAFGWASAHWGDAAWHWLSRRLRWYW